MARRTTEKKDRTSIVISLVIHAIVIGAVAIWAWKTGKLEQMGRRVLEWVKTEKKAGTKRAVQTYPTKAQPPKLPPINQGLSQPTSSGTRRAVAADAPAAVGETFSRTRAGQAQELPLQRQEPPRAVRRQKSWWRRGQCRFAPCSRPRRPAR